MESNRSASASASGQSSIIRRSRRRISSSIPISANNPRNANSGHEIITRSRSRQMMLEISRSIHEEVVLSEILTRLPAKSLMRFKSASRRWLATISDNCFRKTHMEHWEKKNLTEQNVIIVAATNQGSAILHCAGSFLLSQSVMKIDQFELVDLMSHAPLIVGYCNGLCCVLMNGDQFAIGNLSTRQFRELSHIFQKELSHVILYGFGYDEASGDYKVLSVFRTHLSPAQHDIRLYSLKTDSWKAIDNFFGDDAYYTYGGRGEFVSGKIHWLSGDCKKILSFDLGTEAARVFEPPSSAKLLYRKMGVIKGCLAVICAKPNEGMEVWSMEKYGVKESWCRVVVVPYFGTSDYPLFISEDCVVTAHDDDHGSVIFIYDPKTCTLIKRIKLKVEGTYQFDFFIQSLTSPFLQGEPEEPN